MRNISWARARIGRFIIIFLALLSYILLFSLNTSRYFSQSLIENHSFPGIMWLQFGFSAFVALTFLTVGVLVWLYARQRQVAALLLGLSLALMVTFQVQTGANFNDKLLICIGFGASGAAQFLLSALLLVFPGNFLAFPSKSKIAETSQASAKRSRQYYLALGLRVYLIVMFFLCLNSEFFSILYYWPTSQLSIWTGTIDNIYRLIAFIGILVTIVFSYFTSASKRERQQRRLFVLGVILAVAPLLLLTFIPHILQFPSQYVVDSQLTTIPIVLFPLALGYTILRYQVLVFDMYIRRAVAWMVGVVGLTFLGYLVVTIGSVILSKTISYYVVFVVVAMALLSPCIWWLAKLATERLFFSEILHYRTLIDSPDIMSSETFDLNEAARLLTVAAVNTFETQEVCLFVLDEDTGYFQLYPVLTEENPNDVARRDLAQRIWKKAQNPSDKGFDWLDANEPFLKNLAVAHRPLLLSEAITVDGEESLGLGRYLAGTKVLDSAEPLLATVQAQGRMIGILALGERGDHQPYAGPDFEAIFHMLARFSPVLETARLYVKESRHVAILNALFSANTLTIKDYETIEEVAIAYTKIAAEATMASAGLWLYSKQDDMVHFVTCTGSGPQLMSQKPAMMLQEMDWAPWFYHGNSKQVRNSDAAHVPSCLEQTPYFPVAWIPLYRGKQPLGLLTLAYERPHLFSQEEKRVLEMFARQCAVALENASITIELRAAYERQKELDILKDQFIITASHELRTPLTAVLGYIELLAAYNSSLSLETRAEFIAKAHYGCDELALMVNNIMDASRVQLDAENVKLSQVSLVEPIKHVLEILEAMTQREQRAIRVEVPDEVSVMANTIQLRQILLNLMSNALKYSPQGSSIEITSIIDDGHVTLRIHDHGLGVPVEDQLHLFERFVRLERDMNSPVRGAGLGLYICKQLVTAMGGEIWVESSGIPGEGSTFVFKLKRGMRGSDTNMHALEHQEV
jgi:signal transduction histidine kinase